MCSLKVLFNSPSHARNVPWPAGRSTPASRSEIASVVIERFLHHLSLLHGAGDGGGFEFCSLLVSADEQSKLDMYYCY